MSDFHPLVTQWFQQLGPPTEIQAKAWPLIAQRRHCLITAPTGSGKTLTAFLWAINRFVTGELVSGRTRVLYVSPLKALNNDIRNNLARPLAELKTLFAERELPFPDIRVQTRSGDTDAAERRQMVRRPPEFLITTPESLNLLLSSKSGLSLLTELDSVIIDEVHALIDNKRGAYLFSAVERLVGYAGEFQRIALSATVRPLDKIADHVGGYRLDTATPDYALHPRYTRREVAVVAAAQQKRYQVDICYPAAVAERPAEKKLWDALAEELLGRIEANRSTLIFVNNRALCEKLTHKINQAAGGLVAYAHHGSLAREIRREVERKLKSGQLAAIVATSSLEMGIDIGALDEVLLIQTAGSLASAIQRIGRAGHRVGEVSKGVLYPTHPQDFLEAVVLARAVQTRDIEPVQPIHCPLDVLAQVMISMVGTASWDLDELYVHLRTSGVYHSLTREQFDLLINMLAGRYAEQRIRELKPRISVDRIDNTVVARKGALLSLYLAGGVIPNRGYFQLRHADSGARIGELDEEFVWEAKIGQTFTLGTQYWQIAKITHNDVFVRQATPGATPPPFWKAETISRNFYFSARIGELLETAEQALATGELGGELTRELAISAAALQALADYLQAQRQHTACELPHRHHLLIECVSSLLGYGQANQVVIHTYWGAAVNRPWAMALEAAWRQRYGEELEIYTSNESLVLQLPHDIAAETLLTLVPLDRLDDLLRQRLESSGFFGARFRECAGRALLIGKGTFNQRQPLWMSRLRAQKLLAAVLKYEDFPILLETWRDCLQDEFDLPHLRQLLAELERGEIRWSVVHGKTPSPMARNIAWEQVNQYMYRDDAPKSDKQSRLRGDLLHDLIEHPQLRPRISRQACADFDQRRRRLVAGYAPDGSADLLDWVKERIAIPAAEWRALLERIAADGSAAMLENTLAEISSKLARLSLADAELIVAREKLRALIRSFYQHQAYEAHEIDGDGEIAIESLPEFATQAVSDEELGASLLANWLQFYGPRTASLIGAQLGVPPAALAPTLDDLLETRVLVAGQLLEDDEDVYFCDSDNFEILLYLTRRAAQPGFTPLALKTLPLFLATWQQLAHRPEPVTGDAAERLFRILQQQALTFASAGLWESDILPARMPDYDPRQLDHIKQESDLLWLGAEKERVGLCFASDLDLLSEATEEEAPELDALFPERGGRYAFDQLQQKADVPSSELVPQLWRWVWQGKISNDTFAALRRGIAARFRVPDAQKLVSRGKGRRSLRRSGFSQWQQSSPFVGNWFRIDYPVLEDDIIDREERGKDRVRILLERYGILFRELLAHEHPLLQWRQVFRSLRLMELSREVLAGHFFEDLPGPQFVSHQALRVLQKPLPEDSVYWINAKDPVSFCGSAVAGLKAGLPRRLGANHIVYRGSEVALISQRHGRELAFKVAADDPNVPRYLAVLRHLLFRSCRPLKSIQIDSINGRPARESEYLGCLETGFDVSRDYRSVTLYRKLP